MTIEAVPTYQRGPTRQQRWARRLIVASLTLAVIGGAVGWYLWAYVQTYHLREVVHGILYRDGNRDLREFRHAIEKTGARTVVTLIDDAELADPAKPQFAQEAAYCQAHGIQQVRIPVRRGGWPTPDQIDQFLTVIAEADPAHRPVLVHCAQGVRRTGMFVAAYQLAVQDRTKDNVRAAIQDFGHDPRDTDDVRTFIDNYDTAGFSIPATMPSAGGD